MIKTDCVRAIIKETVAISGQMPRVTRFLIEREIADSIGLVRVVKWTILRVMRQLPTTEGRGLASTI